jgi:Tfp pilus assembly protein PilN
MHINLIFEEEQRSASVVSPALGFKLFGMVVVVLGLVWGYSFASHYRIVETNFNATEEEWKQMEPRYKAARQLRRDLTDVEITLKELKMWRDSRVVWSAQLESLRSIVPAVVQLTDLRISQTILSISNNIPVRAYELRLSGKTASVRSKENVVQFLDGFRQPEFLSHVESAALPPGAFRQDPASKNDRIFEIVCKYGVRPLE